MAWLLRRLFNIITDSILPLNKELQSVFNIHVFYLMKTTKNNTQHD